MTDKQLRWLIAGIIFAGYGDNQGAEKFGMIDAIREADLILEHIEDLDRKQAI